MFVAQNPPSAAGPTGIPLPRAQAILAAIWFAFSAVIFLVLIVRTINHSYEANDETHHLVSIAGQVWGAALPQFVPTLSLMVGVFAASAFAPATDPPRVNRAFLFLAAVLSVVYLFAVFAAIAFDSLWRDEGPLKFLEASGLWLAPFQALTASALGALFVAKKKE
jgi:hypothetical protein